MEESISGFKRRGSWGEVVEHGERITQALRQEDIEEVSEAEQERQKERVQQLREDRDSEAVEAALDELREVCESDENVMPAIVDAVKAYATTGEIANAMRDVFGEHRAGI